MKKQTTKKHQNLTSTQTHIYTKCPCAFAVHTHKHIHPYEHIYMNPQVHTTQIESLKRTEKKKKLRQKRENEYRTPRMDLICTQTDRAGEKSTCHWDFSVISGKVHEMSRKNIFYSLIHYRTIGNFWTEDGRKMAALWSGEVKDCIGQQCSREWQQAAPERRGLSVKATPSKKAKSSLQPLSSK